MRVNVNKLHQELLQAGLPVVCVRTSEPVADYARDLTPAEQAQAEAVIAAHDPDAPTPTEQDERQAQAARTDFRTLPQWATWTPDQAKTYVAANVLTGQSKAEVDAWIDANVTSLATAKNGLKLLGAAILDLRAIVGALAYAILLLRDIAVRRS